MRAVVLLVIGVLAVACGERNPNACCNNAVECAEVGFDEVTPCLGVKVCIEGHCVDPTCTTPAECTDPALPYCVGTTCVALCQGDESCPTGTPYCASSGACVACLDSAQCSDPASAVCDGGICRPCTEDVECSTGVCTASEGMCIASQDAVYVDMQGTDRGTCTSAEPCRTVPFALQQLTSSRRVLRIASATFVAEEGIVLDRDVYIDAADTLLQRSGSAGPVVTVTNDAEVTLEGARFVDVDLASPVIHLERGRLTMFDVLVDRAGIRGNYEGSTLRITRSRLVESEVECLTAVTLEILDSELEETPVLAGSGRITIARNRIAAVGDVAVEVVRNNSRPVLIENNQVVVANQGRFLDISRDGAGGQPAVIRYNTIVKGNAAAFPGPIIACTDPSGPVFTSNIVAVGSPAPFTGGSTCVVDHSLFDDAAALPPGTGNISAAFEDILVDFEAGDYRPAASSPARGAGDPAQDPGEDIDGNPRPVPAGSPPDVGAFEVE